MKRILIIKFLLLFIFITGYTCLAQESPQEAEGVILYVGQIKVIAVDNLTRVAISDPKVADIISTKKDEIVIIAKDTGTTNALWWDNLGQHTLQIQVFLEDMQPIKKRIDKLFQEMNLTSVETRALDSEGKVLLLGTVNTVQELERIDTALDALKEKTINLIQLTDEFASVEIEVQVLEVKEDATHELGITPQTREVSLTESMSKYGSTLRDIPEALFHITDWTRQALTAQINFLIREGKARMLSRPKLVCQSGKEAELLVGGEKPILTTQVSDGSSSTDVDYKEYGIKLTINPMVIPKNRIQVALNVDVSEIGTAEILGSVSEPTARAYPLTKRTTSTQLILSNAQTLAISGLIKEKEEKDVQKIPFLGDIPIIGMLFRSKSVRSGGGFGELGDTELVITLTPTILAQTETFPRLADDREDRIKEDLITKAKISYPATDKPGVTDYTLKVIKRIQDNFIYPAEAYENKQAGLVKLSIHLSSNGELMEVKLDQSSGWSILDDNAVRIIKRIAPFPPFPVDIKAKELWINIPIAYNIE